MPENSEPATEELYRTQVEKILHQQIKNDDDLKHELKQILMSQRDDILAHQLTIPLLDRIRYSFEFHLGKAMERRLAALSPIERQSSMYMQTPPSTRQFSPSS